MTTVNLDDAVDSIITVAKTLLERDGVVAPVCFLVLEEGIKIAPFSFKDDREKDETVKLLRRVVKTTKPKAVICVFEGWMAELSKDEKWDDKLPVSQRSDRTECIIAEGVSDSGEESCYIQGFGRDEQGQPVLKEKNKMDRGYSKFLSGIYERGWYN